MYNEARLSKLGTLEVAPVWAILTRLDAAGSYEWLINPSVLTYELATNVTTQAPLGSVRPNIKVQNQTRTFSLPLLLMSPSNNRDMSEDLKILTTFSTLKSDGTLPKLQFSFGDFIEKVCCISSLQVNVRQWRSGKPTMVDGNITIVPYVEVQPPNLSKEQASQTAKTTIALSRREAERLASLMVSAEKTHSGVRVNGNVVEGVNKQTKKLETIFKIEDAVKITFGSAMPTTLGSTSISTELNKPAAAKVIKDAVVNKQTPQSKADADKKLSERSVNGNAARRNNDPILFKIPLL